MTKQQRNPTIKRKGMGRPKASEGKIIKALQAAHGNVTLAAAKLGMNRCNLHERIGKSPALQVVLHDSREALLDNAESALNNAVLSGEAWAVCFTLKTQGKKRGYVERQEITGADGGSVKMEIAEELVDADNQKDLPANPPADAVPPE